MMIVVNTLLNLLREIINYRVYNITHYKNKVYGFYKNTDTDRYIYEFNLDTKQFRQIYHFTYDDYENSRIIVKDENSKEELKKFFINNGSNYPTYWMSSRCVYANSDTADFGVRFVISGIVYAYSLYYSNGDPNGRAFALRPVITLNSNVLVKSGEGTPESAYEIGI